MGRASTDARNAIYARGELGTPDEVGQGEASGGALVRQRAAAAGDSFSAFGVLGTAALTTAELKTAAQLYSPLDEGALRTAMRRTHAIRGVGLHECAARCAADPFCDYFETRTPARDRALTAHTCSLLALQHCTNESPASSSGTVSVSESTENAAGAAALAAFAGSGALVHTATAGRKGHLFEKRRFGDVRDLRDAATTDLIDNGAYVAAQKVDLGLARFFELLSDERFLASTGDAPPKAAVDVLVAATGSCDARH